MTIRQNSYGSFKSYQSEPSVYFDSMAQALLYASATNHCRYDLLEQAMKRFAMEDISIPGMQTIVLLNDPPL